MQFISWQFAVFLPVVFLLYWFLPRRFQKYVLLFASLYFYMSWKTKYVVLLLFVAAVTYAAARVLEQMQSEKTKKCIFTLAVVSCAGLLYVFKYLDFSFGFLDKLASLAGIRLSPLTLKLVMPLGISFFTFQGIGYVSDVYHGRIEAEKDPFIYLSFISFFPQISSGPIARAGDLIPQLKEEREFSYDKAAYAVRLLIWGMFKKMVAADNFAVYVDGVYASLPSYSGAALLIASLLYSIQLYCDFSGYTDMARACAGFFGINLAENFRAPYLASSVKEFWSRWHISLSSWLRDYVYIPLGGSRKGTGKTQRNILITFFVSGLWHGADVSFILWGMLHAAGEIFENLLKIRPCKDRRTFAGILRTAAVFLFVTFAWIFFRADTVSDALYVIGHMFSGIGRGSWLSCLPAALSVAGGQNAFLFRLLLGVIPVAAFDLVSEKGDLLVRIGTLRFPVRFLVCLAALTVIFLFRSAGGVSFVYFQF